MKKAGRSEASMVFLALGFAATLCGCRHLPQGARENFDVMVREARDSGAAVQELIHGKKIVFVSEDHSVVNPILFMTENLGAFQKAGVRYLFLEGGFPVLPESENFDFPIFYPWTECGWKYEGVKLAQALHDLNAQLPEKDRIRVIFAEAGNAEPAVYDPEKTPEILNGRDRFASDRIIRIMEASLPGEKGLVFYGGGHGSRVTVKGFNPGGGVPAFDRKPMGVYLKEKYKDRFSAVDYRYLSEFREYFPSADWPSFADARAFIDTESLRGNTIYPRLNRYDAIVFERDPVYGRGYQFVPTEENLRVMFSVLRRLENSKTEIREDESRFRFGARGRYLTAIYYLKLYYGDRFDYRLWNPEKGLSAALDGLEAYAFAPGLSPSEKITMRPPAESALREYLHLMMDSGIERYINSPESRPELLERMVDSMKRAAELYPEDLWPSYWLAFALTRTGDYSGALSEWRRFLERPLAACMETYPNALRKAAECAERLGMAGKSGEYAAAAQAAANEHELDVSSYTDTL